ncbi:MAG TPA: PspA/IM30 family protein [Myxococcota bacterium]|nr:PspA/IM30 family protein [Myxococcota bacterium]
MTLRIFDRMATLAKADAHGVLDALEERSLVVRQHLREAELALQRKRNRLEGRIREEERLADALARGDAELAKLDDDVALALSGGRDDLARFALKRLLPLRRDRDALAAALADAREERARLAEQLAAHERAFEELRAQVRARLAAPGACAGDLAGPHGVDEEEVEIELLRRKSGGADR